MENNHLTREQRLEALALSANAASCLCWFSEEVQFRKQRLSLLRPQTSNEAKERAALAAAYLKRSRFKEADETISVIDKKWGAREWSEHLQMKAFIILRRDRDYLTAASLLREALSIMKERGSRLEKAAIKKRLGHALRFANRIPEAIKILKEAQTDLSQIMDKSPYALQEYTQCEFLLGDIARLTGELNEAWNLYHRSREMLGDRASVHFLKKYYHRIGTVYLMLGFYEEADDYYNHPMLVNAIERIGNPEDYFWPYMGRAAAACARGDYEKSEAMHKEAEKCIAADSSPFLRSHITLSEAELSFHKEDFGKAKVLYEKAQKGFQSIGRNGDENGICDCLSGRGLVELKYKNIEQAILLAQQCADYAQTTGFLSIRSKELFLKSFILVSGKTDLDPFFHDIMKRYHVIASPVSMYKVLSNVYYYAHKFCEHTIDAAIEKKLKSLKQILNQETHRSLEQQYFDKQMCDLLNKHIMGEQQ